MSTVKDRVIRDFLDSFSKYFPIVKVNKLPKSSIFYDENIEEYECVRYLPIQIESFVNEIEHGERRIFIPIYKKIFDISFYSYTTITRDKIDNLRDEIVNYLIKPDIDYLPLDVKRKIKIEKIKDMKLWKQ